VQDTGEGCDNGELNSDTAPDACRTDCQPYRCGDGVVDDLSGEGCDDGALNGTPGYCSATCAPPGCGDGVYDPATEFCDAGDTGTATCADFGYLAGTLGCTASCGPDVTGCNNCGNAIIDGTEDCDGAALGGASCMTVTGAPGTLACASDCTYDTSGCLSCGNGTVDVGEDCDGVALGGETCASVMPGTGGTLACDTACMFDTTGCMAGACDVDSPPTYTVTPAIMYTCADDPFFFPGCGGPCVNLDIGSFVFSEVAGTLHAGPVTAHFADMAAMMGVTTTCPGGSFTLTHSLPGGCCEDYTLTGTFIDALTWTGTFSADFCQDPSCGCAMGDGLSCDLGVCVSGVWSVTGTR